MKKTLTRVTGFTILGVAVAAGLAFAQSGGSPPNGPGGRSTDAPGQPVPTITPDASDRNALPSITPAQPEASAPDASLGTDATSPDASGMDSDPTATRRDGSTVNPAGPASTTRSPRADRN